MVSKHPLLGLLLALILGLTLGLSFPAAARGAADEETLLHQGALYETLSPDGWVCTGVDYEALAGEGTPLSLLREETCEKVDPVSLGFTTGQIEANRRPGVHGIYNSNPDCYSCFAQLVSIDGDYTSCNVRFSNGNRAEVFVYGESHVDEGDCAAWCSNHEPVGPCTTLDGWKAADRTCMRFHERGRHRIQHSLQ